MSETLKAYPMQTMLGALPNQINGLWRGFRSSSRSICSSQTNLCASRAGGRGYCMLVHLKSAVPAMVVFLKGRGGRYGAGDGQLYAQ